MHGLVLIFSKSCKLDVFNSHLTLILNSELLTLKPVLLHHTLPLPLQLLHSPVERAQEADPWKTRARGLHLRLWLGFPLCWHDPHCSAVWAWLRQGWLTIIWPRRQISLFCLPLNWHTITLAPCSMNGSLLIYTLIWPVSQKKKLPII